MKYIKNDNDVEYFSIESMEQFRIINETKKNRKIKKSNVLRR